jgi:RNA polymerase sigma-70 factor (ECF subfamily)
LVDAEGFEAFYRATYSRVVTQVLMLVGNRQDAEEIVQEALTRALTRWTRIRDYDVPEQWVRRVAFNLAKTQHRQLRRRMAALVRHGPPDDLPDVSIGTVALVQALAKISANYREVLVLHYVAHLSVNEIAAELALPVGTVKTRLARGRQAVAPHLVLYGEEVHPHDARSAPAVPSRERRDPAEHRTA